MGGLEALGDDHDAKLALQVLARGVLGELVADAVAFLAPREGAGRNEFFDPQAVVEGAAEIVADGAGRADREEHAVVHEIVGDMAGVLGEAPQAHVIRFRDAFRVGIEDDVVLDDDAPVEEQVLQAVRVAGVKQQHEPAGAGGEVVAEQFLLEGLEAALRTGDDDERRVLGDLVAEVQVETGDLVIARPQLVPDAGEAAAAVHIIGAHFAVAGEEVDFFLLRAGDVEQGGGEGGLAAETLAAAGAGLVEIAEREHAPVVVADEHDLVGGVEAEGLGVLAVLVDIEVAHLDLALGVVAGEVGVFAEQAADVAVGLGDLLLSAVVGNRDDDPDVAVELLKVGAGLGGE